MNRLDPLPLGTNTRWGKVASVLLTGGERYYMLERNGDVALMPADVVEMNSSSANCRHCGRLLT